MLLLLALLSVAEAPGRPPVAPHPCPITVDLTGHLHAPFHQGANACRVEVQLRIAGWEDRLIAGALANAWHESGWKAGIPGDGGASVGFWQLHEKGLGAGMGDLRYDLRSSTSRVIRSARRQGLNERTYRSAGQASEIFCRKVMRPKHLTRDIRIRRQTASLVE